MTSPWQRVGKLTGLKVSSSRTDVFSVPEPDAIRVVDDFASSGECAELLGELVGAYWRSSRTYERQTDETFRSVLAGKRISETAHQYLFADTLVGLLERIDERLAETFDVDPVRLEWWQGTRYPIGGRFDYHLDSGYWDDHPAGDRVRTFLLYLTTPTAGGGTHFRAYDLLVEPRAGRLVVWDDLFADGTPNHSMIHAGLPVEAGEKVTLVTWERQKAFRSEAAEAT